MDVPRAHSPVTAGVEGRGARVLSVRDRCRRSEESALIEQEVQDGRGRSSTAGAVSRRCGQSALVMVACGRGGGEAGAGMGV